MSEPNTKKMVKKWLKNTKAVSPIIATLLMIVISVVAGVMIYGWISGFITTGVPSAPQLYIVSVGGATNYNGTGAVTLADSEGGSGWGQHGFTDIKIRVSNTGTKDIPSITAANIVLRDTSGTEYDSISATYRVIQIASTSAINASDGAYGTTASTDSVAINAGATTSVYVRVINATVEPTTDAKLSYGLPIGATYSINLIDVTAYDGSPVTSAETPVRVTQ